MENEFLIPISFFALVYGILYLIFRRKERLMMIQKGINANLFETEKRTPTELKWGLLMIGIGIGILFGKVLAVHTALEEEPAFFSMICLFGGIGLIIFHILANKIEQKGK